MAPATLIEPFEVPPGADEAFLAQAHPAGAAVHRALRADVAFRFVVVARADVLPDDRPTEFRSHPALYDVVHEDGAPDGTEGVVLIDPFEVPPDGDTAFLAGWGAAREWLATRPGYLGTRLHRSPGAAAFRFVNIARWSSPLMFARAVGAPELRAAGGAPAFPSHPALYLVADR